MQQKTESLAPAWRPWLLGVPGFFLALSFLVWIIARLASWIVLSINR
jgi:hypothetical protein